MHEFTSSQGNVFHQLCLYSCFITRLLPAAELCFWQLTPRKDVKCHPSIHSPRAINTLFKRLAKPSHLHEYGCFPIECSPLSGRENSLNKRVFRYGVGGVSFFSIRLRFHNFCCQFPNLGMVCYVRLVFCQLHILLNAPVPASQPSVVSGDGRPACYSLQIV